MISEYDACSVAYFQAVLKLVHDNENLRTHIAPVLKQRKEDCSSTDNKQSGEGKDKDKDDKIDNLVFKLSALIDSEVRRKTCIQLKPDLKKFMEDMMKQNCKGKPNKKDEDDDDDEEDDDEGGEDGGGSRKRRSLVSDFILIDYCYEFLFLIYFISFQADHQEIKEKYRVLTELLQEYNKLPYEEQEKIAQIKEYIQNHVNLLDELEINSNYLENYYRIKREIIVTSDADLKAALTDKFRKLQETATFIQENVYNKANQLDRLQDEMFTFF